MTRTLDGSVAVVTGAGAGLGRAEALDLAAAGAAVVVNDTGVTAREVVEEIVGMGGQAVAVLGDVSHWSTGEALRDAALGSFGRWDILVNNAGIVRDRMVFTMPETDWDMVVAVHLKGHFVTTRFAMAYWKQQSKETGEPARGAIVNTSSEAFLSGAPGQPNYAAAKAGIVALTLSTARAGKRFGVRANAICPRARTAMTESVFTPAPIEGADPMAPQQVTPLVTYLAGPDAGRINGQVFIAFGGTVKLLASPTIEHTFASEGAVWTNDDVAEQLGGYFDGRDPERTFSAEDILSQP